jgi:predicted DNA-binding antitoxin AbrB/MazE fold protein
MKAHHFIAPALAAVAGGFWISQQEDTLTELEEKTRVVRERLQKFEVATTSASSSPAPAGSVDGAKDEFTLADGTLDWKAIGQLIAEAQKGGGMPTNMKTFMKLQAKLMEMDESEIEEGFNKIATLDLTEDVAQQLKQSLIQMLAEKNPEKALNLMGDIISSRQDQLHWTQQNAFKKLAAKDPAAARAWLDQQLKDGKFVSKALDPSENPRLRFESALLGGLLKSDLATVRSRLATFSADERKQLFSDTHQWRQGGKMPVEFLELARENLDGDEATQTIAEAWSSRHNVDLKEVTKPLKELPFSEGERHTIVKKSIDHVLQNNREDDNHRTAYEWAREHDAESAGPLIAESLARTGMWGNELEGNFEKALDLSDSFQDPLVAREFVNLYARENDSNWQEALNKFEDPALAEKMRAIYETLPAVSE